MSKNGSEIQKYLQSPGLRAVLFLTVPIIVILIIIMFVVILQPGRIEELRLVIDNIEEVLPDVPSETVHLIEEKLYMQVLESGVDMVPEDGAIIRENSWDGFTIQDKLYVGDFIVDIASVDQSYIMSYYYGELPDNNEMESAASVMTYCIEDPSEIIYVDFECRANHDFAKPDPIQYILPRLFDGYSLSYTYSLTSDSGYAIVVTYNPPESVYLDGKVEEFENESMSKIRSFLIQEGLDPERYEFVSKYEIVE